MAYSERAKEKRRCTYRFPEGHGREGERCKAWAMWGSEGQLCVAHGTDGRGKDRPDGPLFHRTIPKCTCEAYNFPHRPGGGLCRWPEAPKFRLTTPEGTSTGRGIPAIPWGSYKVARNVIEPGTVQAEAEALAGKGPNESR